MTHNEILKEYADELRRQKNICKWTRVNAQEAYTSSCKKYCALEDLNNIEFSHFYKFCPYCGKDIEVIG